MFSLFLFKNYNQYIIKGSITIWLSIIYEYLLNVVTKTAIDKDTMWPCFNLVCEGHNMGFTFFVNGYVSKYNQLNTLSAS